MRTKAPISLITLAIVLALAPWNGLAYSQKGGVAGGSRASRGAGSPTAEDSTRKVERSRHEAPTDEFTARRMLEIESLEQQCLDEVNRVRRAQKLHPLSMYENLLHVARDYSRRMGEERFFSHADPEGRTVRERVDEADIKWRMVGENLAYSNGYVNPVAASLRGWMESPGHRRNILEPEYTLTAIGVWIAPDGTVYFTEIFLKQ